MNEQTGHLGSEVLQAFLEGELPDATRVEAEAHLERCARCSSELEGWSLLFAELGELPEVAPSADFSERVMAQITAPAPSRLPLRDRVFALLPGWKGGQKEHLAPDRIQDLLDGAVAGWAALGIRSHLRGCHSCRSEVERWEGVFASLQALPRFAPSGGFTERVMAALPASPQTAVAVAPSPIPGFGKIPTLVAAARRLVPTTRRGWGLAGTALAAPAVGLVVLVGSVVLHPLISFGDLGLYAAWRGAEAIQGVLSWMGGLMVQSPLLYQLYGVVETLVAAPALAAVLLLAFWGLTLASAWVLYRQVIAPSFSGNRNVHAS